MPPSTSVLPTKLAHRLRYFGRHVPRRVASSYGSHRTTLRATNHGDAPGANKLVVHAAPQSDYGGASDDVIMCLCVEHPPFYVIIFWSPGHALDLIME